MWLCPSLGESLSEPYWHPYYPAYYGIFQNKSWMDYCYIKQHEWITLHLYTGQGAIVRTGHGTTDWFQIGKGYVKAVYCHPAYLTYMQSTSRETLGWRKHKLESRLLGEISTTSDMQMTPPLWQKVKKKEPLDESEREEWKRWLKAQHSEN